MSVASEMESVAVVLESPQGPINVRTVALHEPRTGEALIRMEACGICHSDLFVSGLGRLPRAPLTLGHEGIGRVEAVGPAVTDFKPGDRVGITFLASTCGECELCRAGRERFCPRQLNFGYSVNGALSARAVAPVAQLFRVPEDLPAEAAAPLCCAGWTAYASVRESGIRQEETLALFGMGGLGHLAVQYAKRRGCRVAVADVSESKLELARGLGADIAVLAQNAGRTLHREHGGVHAAIVLTASTAAIKEAFGALKRNGTLILVGLSTSDVALPLADLVLRGINVRGSYLGSREDLNEVFSLARSGAVRSHVHTHSIEEAPAILEQMRRGEMLGRAVVRF